MAEVNKEELRRLAEVLFESENDDAFDAWEEATHPWKILPLLDENAAQAARIAELELECERLHEQVDKRIQQCQAMMMDKAKLRAELEACRKDAERWRHMRDLVHPEEIKGFQEARKSWSVRPSEKISQQCDAAIDAAMQEGGV